MFDTKMNSVEKNIRLNFVWAYIGKNTTGKTPTAIYNAKIWQKAKPKHKLIVFDSQDKFFQAHKRGEIRVDILLDINNKQWAEMLAEYTESKIGEKKYKYANSLVILDDYRMLCRGNDMSPAFYSLLSLREKINMDFKIICHMPRNILEGLAGFITHYSIFANNAHQASFERKISCYVQCQTATLVIKKYVELYGRGYYDIRKKNPVFPYLNVDKENEMLECVNMDMEKARPILKEFTQKAS